MTRTRVYRCGRSCSRVALPRPEVEADREIPRPPRLEAETRHGPTSELLSARGGQPAVEELADVVGLVELHRRHLGTIARSSESYLTG